MTKPFISQLAFLLLLMLLPFLIILLVWEHSQLSNAFTIPVCLST